MYIRSNEWSEVIKLSKSNNLKIWLDIFCSYGIKILEENTNNIYGIKLQSSILDNFEIYKSLKNKNLQEKIIIINSSCYLEILKI